LSPELRRRGIFRREYEGATLRENLGLPRRDNSVFLGGEGRSYFNYHAVPTNSRALGSFRHYVLRLWQRTLRRRSQKDNTTWERMTRLADDWLPKPNIPHPWPNVRFAVKHPRWEPYARIGPVRICAGGAQQ
jgi:RNA-directed DNA polymerase